MSIREAISVDDLRKRFDRKDVLQGLSFAVPAGCLFGFLGPNGAGKTTTMNLLTGILLPDSGRIRILGEPMSPENSALRRRIGAVHDSFGLFEQMTGEEHLLFSASLHGLDAARIPARSRELLALLDLADSASTRIQEYSHGMKKKLALACALIHDPDALFLDEPFEGLDALSARLVMENLRALARRGKTIFMTSHILEIVEKLCDEVAILADGKVVHQEALAAHPGEPGRLERIFFEIASGERDRPLLSWANRREE